jgi:hypothetical protein
MFYMRTGKFTQNNRNEINYKSIRNPFQIIWTSYALKLMYEVSYLYNLTTNYINLTFRHSFTGHLRCSLLYSRGVNEVDFLKTRKKYCPSS